MTTEALFSSSRRLSEHAGEFLYIYYKELEYLDIVYEYDEVLVNLSTI